MTDWRISGSNVRPQEIDTKSSKVVNYVRRNIEEVTTTDEEGNETVSYTYEERKVNKTEWDLYLKLVEVEKANEALETQITETQMALCDIYESLL